VAAVAQIENAIALTVSFTGLPGYAIDSAVSIHDGFITAVKDAVSKDRANKDALADFDKKLDELESVGAALLVTDVSGYASKMDSLIGDLKNVPEDDDTEDNDTLNTKKEVSESISVYDSLFTYTDEQDALVNEEPPTTPTRVQETKNNNALVQFIRQLAIVRASEAAANQTYTSLDAAVAQRNSLNDLIDEQLNIVDLEDDLFQSLKDQKSSNVSLIPDPRKETGTVKEIDIPETTPSLVLVYEEYGNVTNETEVIDRNKIENPAFMDGTIEVIRFG